MNSREKRGRERICDRSKIGDLREMTGSREAERINRDRDREEKIRGRDKKHSMDIGC